MLEQRVRWHLQYNHYPPIHEDWIESCMQALEGMEEVEVPTNLYESTDERVITDAWRLIEVFELEEVA